MTPRSLLPGFGLALIASANFLIATAHSQIPAGVEMLARYFESETHALTERCLTDIHSLDEWNLRRGEYRRQLQEMLGLWPMPERTELKPVITGRIERDDFIVEKLHFQASPGLYVTGNLYLPKNQTGPAPTILYVAGHSKQVKDGVSFGNKTGYQHHGIWFARHGYVCLIIDTLQLAEIQGLHHGTHRLGMWWWNSRGYTPAGVEAWFGIRALDYLETRPEVDKSRFGVTGRSGGGSYSWTVAALDDRVKVAAPVAGITDLQNHVVDDTVEGHCDCMFFVNTYRWDFPLVAALVAPRPLLIANSDKDRIFPLEGIVRLHEKARRVYQLHGATDKLGLLITEGPHQDTQDLQVPVFRWFNRFLKGGDEIISVAATKLFEPAELKVFGQLPADERNITAHDWFVPEAPPLPTPFSAGEWADRQARWRSNLLTMTFAGWPTEACALEVQPAFRAEKGGLRLEAWDFDAQPEVRLRLYLLRASGRSKPDRVVLIALDEKNWQPWLASLAGDFGNVLNQELAGVEKRDSAGDSMLKSWRDEIQNSNTALAFVAPRGIGMTAWNGDEKKQTHIRRRFMLLGQTLDGMRVWDIRRALETLRTTSATKGAKLEMRGAGDMGVNCLYAAIFEPEVDRLELGSLHDSHRDGPDYLNVLRVLDLPQALSIAAEQTDVRVR